MNWVDKTEIPVDLAVKKEVKKITLVKSFNMRTSIAGKSGVFMRDNSQLERTEERVYRYIFYPHVMNKIC